MSNYTKLAEKLGFGKNNEDKADKIDSQRLRRKARAVEDPAKRRAQPMYRSSLSVVRVLAAVNDSCPGTKKSRSKIEPAFLILYHECSWNEVIHHLTVVKDADSQWLRLRTSNLLH